MSDIHTVHVLCSHPSHTSERFKEVLADLRAELPAMLARSCSIPQPYVEVCVCGTSRDDIRVHLSGLDCVCGTGTHVRHDACVLIEGIIRRHVTVIPIEVIDDDVSSRRDNPSRFAGRQQEPAQVALH